MEMIFNSARFGLLQVTFCKSLLLDDLDGPFLILVDSAGSSLVESICRVNSIRIDRSTDSFDVVRKVLFEALGSLSIKNKRIIPEFRQYFSLRNQLN